MKRWKDTQRNAPAITQTLAAATAAWFAEGTALDETRIEPQAAYAGEALRSELHYRSGMLDDAVAVSQLQEAKAAYDAAITSASGKAGGATLVAMATYGLGLCSEEVGDFVKAEEIYNSIVANAEFEGTVFPTQAANRIAGLADNKANVIFTKASVVEAPVVETSATTPVEIPAAPVVETPAVEVKAAPAEAEAK